jgi:hypothetical protein
MTAMPEYLLLIYEDEASLQSVDTDTFGEILAGHQTFVNKYRAAIKDGKALQPTSTATSLRRERPADRVVTDGAFAETKEALGGYYLVEAADLDEALRMAEDLPARFGGVEIRPVRAFD